ncbi:MAG: putative transrane anti-sigma factor [Deltaproteobacteria bacterium]|nr:putative transrane anti-sigma factor [Deltaproteobacteria bacterium]
MNCEEVATHFSDYLDKSLDTATMTRVATHVIACPLCRAESSDLADCIEQVASLPALDPPLGFAQRVMAHVREVEEKPSIWQWLFQSWSKSIPLQTTAVVMIAVLAAFLYQKDEPLKQNDSMNLALQSAAPTATAENERALTSESLTPPPVDSLAENKLKTAVQGPAEITKPLADIASAKPLSRLSAPSEVPQTPAPLKAEVESRLEEKKEAARKPPIRALEVTTGREASGVFGFGPSLPLGEMRQLAPRSVPMALENSLPLGDRTTDFEFVVRRRAAQRRDQAESASVDSMRQSAENDATPNMAARRPAPPAAAAPKIESFAEIRFYNVAPEHFEIFKKELAAETNIESESKAAAKEKTAATPADRPLLIKVTILPPDTTAPPR